MKRTLPRKTSRRLVLLLLLPVLLASAFSAAGCRGHGWAKGKAGRNGEMGPEHDPPFPLGAVTDAHWETQQTNAEAADFIFFDHEFSGNTAQLAPGTKKKLMQVALRLEHVPFPVVIEESVHNRRPQLDQQRRRTIIEQLARLGVEDVEERVVIASAFAEGFTAVEGEAAYYRTLHGVRRGGGGGGFGFGGSR